MTSMLEALKKAKLVDEKKAEEIEEERRKLANEESNKNAVIYADADASKDEEHLNRATKETSKPSSATEVLRK